MIIEEIKTGKKTTYKYDGVKYDSKEEIYFVWYLEELKQKGYINSYLYHPKQFDLTMGFYYYTTEQKKRGGEKTTAHTLAQPQTYTPDFIIHWNHKGYSKFCKHLSDYAGISGSIFDSPKETLKRFFWCQSVPFVWTTYVDIKPSYTKRDSDAAIFSLKRALMLQMHHIHVQKVIIDDCFAKTFVPERFLECDKSDRKRKINFEIKHLQNV